MRLQPNKNKGTCLIEIISLIENTKNRFGTVAHHINEIDMATILFDRKKKEVCSYVI